MAMWIILQMINEPDDFHTCHQVLMTKEKERFGKLLKREI